MGPTTNNYRGGGGAGVAWRVAALSQSSTRGVASCWPPPIPGLGGAWQIAPARRPLNIWRAHGNLTPQHTARGCVGKRPGTPGIGRPPERPRECSSSDGPPPRHVRVGLAFAARALTHGVCATFRAMTGPSAAPRLPGPASDALPHQRPNDLELVFPKAPFRLLPLKAHLGHFEVPPVLGHLHGQAIRFRLPALHAKVCAHLHGQCGARGTSTSTSLGGPCPPPPEARSSSTSCHRRTKRSSGPVPSQTVRRASGPAEAETPEAHRSLRTKTAGHG